MDDAQRQTLLRVTRDTAEAVITGRPVPGPRSNDAELNVHCGCFVTLKNQGQLRGCIGQFTSDKPLIELVSEMAKASATGDPRFLADPITPEELGQLDIELSVLSPLERTDDPLGLHLGVHGIYIKSGCASGCFRRRWQQRRAGARSSSFRIVAPTKRACPQMLGRTRRPRFIYLLHRYLGRLRRNLKAKPTGD